MAALTASSSTSGFFQALPIVEPIYTSARRTSRSGTGGTSDEVVFERVLHVYLPEEVPEEVDLSIHNLSRLVLDPSTRRLIVDCETNHPKLVPLNTFGQVNKSDPLVTSEGWRLLKEIGIREGTVASGYQQPGETAPSKWNRRVHQFGLIHTWTPHSALVNCPASMTDGAAKLLSKHLSDSDEDQPGFKPVIREVYARLISRDPSYAWTSGQWMTERTGGSDVRGTETVARKLSVEEIETDKSQGRDKDAHGMPLGPWHIDGFKWFSSATDSDMAVMLAQTSKGLSAFYAPMRRSAGSLNPGQTELNGIRIQRLKNKMGTKGLPTAELELKHVRCWLIGEEGKGIKEIAAILNLTRLHTANGGIGYWAQGLSVGRAYTRTRKVRDGLLQNNPQHLRWMAAETVKYWASVHLALFGAALLGISEQGLSARTKRAELLIPGDRPTLDTLLRLLTPVMKAQVSVRSVEGLRVCMESLGGVGYCENNEDGGIMNIARIFRDAVVGPIWEGTVSIMAEDAVRVLTDKRLGDGNVVENVFGAWVKPILDACSGIFKDECALLQHKLAELTSMANKMDSAELHWNGRSVLEHLDTIACGCLLMYDAVFDGDEVATEIARRWVWSTAPNETRPLTEGSWRDIVNMDQKIFLGNANTASLSKL